MISAVVLIAGVLSGVGLLVGVVLAVVVLIWAQDMASALRIIGNGYYAVVGLMPVALWLALYISHDEDDYDEAYDSRLRSLLTAIQGAVVGSILGAGPIFLTVVINVPVILGSFDISEFGPQVRDEVVWSLLLLAVGAAIAAAIPLGLWVFYIRDEADDD